MDKWQKRTIGLIEEGTPVVYGAELAFAGYLRVRGRGSPAHPHFVPCHFEGMEPAAFNASCREGDRIFASGSMPRLGGGATKGAYIKAGFMSGPVMFWPPKV